MSPLFSDLFLNHSKLHYETVGVTRLGDLCSYLTDYQYVFKNHTSDLNPQALAYLEGLFLTERNKRNIERMSEQNNQQYQNQHHFLSDSPWSAQALMQRISLDTNAMLGDYTEQC